ncbi:serine palmitoyltransferase 2 [Mycena leptocephala]|nr:serine palmitoyltransferase 2 [Mycena leptocephala]
MSLLKKKASSRSATPVTSYFSALAQAESHGVNGVSPTATPPCHSHLPLPPLQRTLFCTRGHGDGQFGWTGPPNSRPKSSEVFTTVHTELATVLMTTTAIFLSTYLALLFSAHVDQDHPYVLFTYISYLILICLGHLRDFFGKRLSPASYRHLMPNNGYAPLNSDFDSFYTRRLKTRMDECFSQPVTGVAGRTIQLLDRISPDYNHHQIFTGTRTRALISLTLWRRQSKAWRIFLWVPLEGGSSDLHVLAEALVAKFVGTEDALISDEFGLHTFTGWQGCLVISDDSTTHPFVSSLLREAISQGQNKSHRPWKKILLVVEGLYSMEGTLVNLPAIMELKKKYKFYLFVDEAHSVGALGPHGRGVADYFNIPPRSIDILMGTFTKSFGAAGGYIAGSKALIDRLRVRGIRVVASMASIMGVSPPTLTSSNSSSSTLKHPLEIEPYHHPGRAPASSLPTWLSLPKPLSDGSEGLSRLRRLAFNSRYLHQGLIKLGFITYGHPASPIVPLLLFNPGKMNMFHWMMKDRQTPIIVVVVAYPATPLVTSRVRFCVSASHTKEDIDTILRACDEVGDILDLKHGLRRSERWTIDQVCARALELVNL